MHRCPGSLSVATVPSAAVAAAALWLYLYSLAYLALLFAAMAADVKL